MALRLSGEEFSVVQGLDAQGWLREIQVNDAASGLEITQSGSGAGLRLAAGHMVVAHGEAIELYNSADEVTDYERLRAYWSGNVAYLATEKGGSGSSRNMALYPLGGTLQVLDGSGNVKATFNANGLRVGDATAPTVSLEAANGLMLAAGNLNIHSTNNYIGMSGSQMLINGADGVVIADAGMHLVQIANGTITLKRPDTVIRTSGVNGEDAVLQARDTDVGYAEIARLKSDTHARFCHTRPVNLLGAAASELTIATGAITITAGYHTVDTEGDAATDDLDTINGGRTGDILVIAPANAARTVVAKHGTGNLNLSGGADFTMDEDDDFLVLLLIGSTWQEISRSENHA